MPKKSDIVLAEALVEKKLVEQTESEIETEADILAKINKKLDKVDKEIEELKDKK